MQRFSVPGEKPSRTECRAFSGAWQKECLTLKDLKFRTNELADFVLKASKKYWFDPKVRGRGRISNGANIAASMLLLRPEILSGAILFRAMLPLEPEKLPNLKGKKSLPLRWEIRPDHPSG